VRLLVTGGTGVLGRALRPLAEAAGHEVAWRENDRLRADASRILVDAATAAGAAVYVQPTVTFVYPTDGPVSEDTPVREVLPILRSALAAEQQTERFARAGGRGVVLRFGLLDGVDS
jgi:nucleoside-diphosphate-sugar epimerase